MAVINGDAGANTLNGTEFGDTINGNGGNDTLRGNGGNDTLDGGAGSDTADYRDKTASVVVSLAGSANASVRVGGVVEDTIRNIERVAGGSGTDTLTGDGLANVLYGNGGNDTLRGNGGNDTLDGGAGSDTADYRDKTASVVVTLAGASNATVRVGGVAEDTIRNIERVAGGSGHDTLTGDGLANVLYGNGGNDTLRGGLGQDVLDGGTGSDTADYRDKTASVVVTLAGAGNASVRVGGVVEDAIRNVERVAGGSGNDTLSGDGLANVLYGNGGNDTLRGGLGQDVLDGGTGSDTADYRDKTASVVVTLAGAGNASVRVGGVVEDTIRNIERVAGGSGNDTLTGDGLANVLYGNGGNDTLRGNAGNDTLDGGAGSDTADYRDKTTSVVVTLAGASNATVTVNGIAEDTIRNIERVAGGSGNDTLNGDDLVNVLYGNDGNDTLSGGLGADVLNGGNGDDYASYALATGSVTVSLDTPGNNTGEAAGDSYASIERIAGSAFADILTGDAGDNVLRGNGGADQLDGGAGFDFASYFSSSVGVTISLANPGANTGDGAGDTYVSIEGLAGSVFDDSLTGDSSGNWLIGHSGADELDGGAGFDWAGYTDATFGVTASLANPLSNTGEAAGDAYISIEGLVGSRFSDTLIGDAGGNSLNGGAGADTLNGQAGFDYATYFNATAGVTASLASPGANTGDAAGDTYAGIEGLGGSDFDDVLIGDAGLNWLRGELGADTLVGGGGQDTASYWSATAGLTVSLAAPALMNTGEAVGDMYDSIEWLGGSQFDDTLIGDGGDNWLFGEAGADELVGGAGSDTAAYASSSIGLTVALINPGASTGEAAGDTYDSIENLSGTSFGDVLIGDGSNNMLIGSTGQDFFHGGAGNDTFFGASTSTAGRFDGASDVVVYNQGYDGLTQGITVDWAAGTATGQAGIIDTDRLNQIEGVYGTALDDTFDATGYSAAIATSGDFGGYQLVRGGGGNDTITGNFNTEAVYSDATGGITATMTTFGSGTVTGGGIGTDTLVGVNRLIGSSFADAFFGTDGAEIFDGGTGGDDIFHGGSGADTVEFDGSNRDAVMVDLASGVITGTGPGSNIGTDTLDSIEQIRGSEFADTYDATGFSGTSANAGSLDTFNQFEGHGGADTVTGNGATRLVYFNATGGVEVTMNGSGSGTATATYRSDRSTDTFTGVNRITGSNLADTFNGVGGDDFFEGRDGNDTLSGGGGNDHLSGGAGNDVLSGGAGGDQFVFNTALGTTSNVDTIMDFDVPADIVMLDDAIFSALSTGTLAAGAFVAGAAAQDADDRIIYDGVTGALFYDNNGNLAGGSTQFAQLQAGLSLTNADFVVI